MILEEELHAREADLNNKHKVLEKLANQNEDLKKENNKISLKLRQIQTTQLKDMQKKLRDKDSELEVLKEMIRSLQITIKATLRRFKVTWLRETITIIYLTMEATLKIRETPISQRFASI